MAEGSDREGPAAKHRELEDDVRAPRDERDDDLRSVIRAQRLEAERSRAGGIAGRAVRRRWRLVLLPIAVLALAGGVAYRISQSRRDASAAAFARLSLLTGRMCACSSTTCAQEVAEATSRWWNELGNELRARAERDEEIRDRLTALENQLATCTAKAMSSTLSTIVDPSAVTARLPLNSPSAPPCMGPLICPPGTTVKPTPGGEQCTRPDGVADGPGHGRTPSILRGPDDETPAGFICLEMKNGKLVGTSREYWSTGLLKYERSYVDGVQRGRRADYDQRGKLTSEHNADGLTIGYFTDGNKQFEGMYETIPGLAYEAFRREGTWTRWFENGQERFQCDFVANQLSGNCTAWDDTGTVAATATYSAGRLVSGKQVGPFFDDKERPILGKLAAPTATITVDQLLEQCEAFTGQPIHVAGTVLDSYECPRCPRGAKCPTCFGNYFVLSNPGRKQHIAVMGPTAKTLLNTSVVVEGRVDYSPGAFVLGPCMVRHVATVDRKSGQLLIDERRPSR